MGNSYNAYEQSREFVPAGLTDVQSSRNVAHNFPRKAYQPARNNEVKPQPPQEQPAQTLDAPRMSNQEQARQIEQFLTNVGDRLTNTRYLEASGVADVQSDYGLAR